MNKFIDWFVNSSKDPTRLATTMKGLILGALPIILIVSKMLGLEIGEIDVGLVAEAIESIIIYVFGTVSAIIFIYGFFRKIVISLRRKMLGGAFLG